MFALAEKALSEGRVVHAIAYFRMAEFFMFDGNPGKLEIYRKARALFYDHYADIFENGFIGHGMSISVRALQGTTRVFQSCGVKEGMRVGSR